MTDPRGTLLAGACALMLLVGAAAATPAGAEDPPSKADRIEELQQDLDSLIEDVEDLQEPIAEFDQFDECMYLIGVSEYGSQDGAAGFAFGRGALRRRPALALDIRGFGQPDYEFLAFPAEEPPSIECNEDAGEEDSDD
jgi:outer membrane receptor protein involved in Fe transport